MDEYRCETRTTPLTRNDDDIWFICRYRVRICELGDQIVITFDLEEIHSDHRCVRGLGSSANVYEVNEACSTLGTLSSFHDKVLAHEKKHETSLNKCLASQTAADWQSELEAVVGKGSDGSETLEDKWNDFLGVLSKANEGMVAGDRSDSAMWHRVGRLDAGLWDLNTVQTAGHSGTDGC